MSTKLSIYFVALFALLASQLFKATIFRPYLEKNPNCLYWSQTLQQHLLSSSASLYGIIKRLAETERKTNKWLIFRITFEKFFLLFLLLFVWTEALFFLRVKNRVKCYVWHLGFYFAFMFRCWCLFCPFSYQR